MNYSSLDNSAHTRAFADLAEKLRLEEDMRSAPADHSLRQAYFDLLGRMAATTTGLGWAVLPELSHPLFFRHGSTDVASMVQIFLLQRYDVPLRTRPRRILDLGAYVGYAAVHFAQRFPDAKIFCVEPMVAAFRVLLLNTLPYQNIICRNVGVWGRAARLSAHTVLEGESGMYLSDGVEQGGISCDAQTITTLLHSAEWPHADLVKSSIAGAEIAVFADPKSRWLNTLDALLIVTHDDIVPGASHAVEACFDPVDFAQSMFGEIAVFERKLPFHALLNATAPEITLINPGVTVSPFFVQDVDPVPWGFFTFDGTSCQLHPNSPAVDRPARLIFPRSLSGQSRAVTWVMHAGVQSAPIRFLLRIEAEDGRVIAETSKTLVEGCKEPIELEFEVAFGRHRIILQTEMAPGHPSNRNAWARWLNPRLA